jgi:peptidyl-prolyl cis-trans isomerase C
MNILVNGVAISEHDINAEAQYHPAGDFSQARQLAARSLAVRELLLQEARRLGVRAEDNEHEVADEALIRALVEREVRVPEADEAACHTYYRNNRKRFRSQDLYEAAHILFAAGPEDAETRVKARHKAEQALAALSSEPQRFNELAQQLSDCPSKTNGGYLGQLTRGDLVPEFERAVLCLEAGSICPQLVETRYGFHVAKLIRFVPGKELPFEVVRQRIADYLESASWQRAVAQYIQLLAGQARITGIELNGAATPLVQ